MTLLRRESFELPADHPVFAGHFPGRPIVPGALLVDEVVRLVEGIQPDGYWCCRNAKFLSPAQPGQTLVVELSATAQTDQITFRVAHADTAVAVGMLERIEAVE